MFKKIQKIKKKRKNNKKQRKKRNISDFLVSISILQNECEGD